MKNTAWSLGLAGLIPFIGLPLLASLGLMDWFTASRGFVSYSGVILSFLGGVHWYDAINGNPAKHQIYIAMVPSILAWIALFLLPVPLGLACLSVGFLLLMMYDKKVLQLPKDKVIWYTKLRMVLTTVVVFTHAWVIRALS